MYSFPLNLRIMDNVVSMVVAPPTEIGDNLPKYLAKNGANNKAIISRVIFDNNAIVPS